jgi:hypothetical protein
VVCDPRRNALLQEGNQNDRVDARKLAELLQNNQLRSVYHGDHGLRALKELVPVLRTGGLELKLNSINGMVNTIAATIDALRLSLFTLVINIPFVA